MASDQEDRGMEISSRFVEKLPNEPQAEYEACVLRCATEIDSAILEAKEAQCEKYLPALDMMHRGFVLMAEQCAEHIDIEAARLILSAEKWDGICDLAMAFVERRIAQRVGEEREKSAALVKALHDIIKNGGETFGLVHAYEDIARKALALYQEGLR